MADTESDRRTVLALARRIDRRGDTGQAPRWAVETLEFGDYISFGGPRPGVNPYNCYRLTERGAALIATV